MAFHSQGFPMFPGPSQQSLPAGMRGFAPAGTHPSNPFLPLHETEFDVLEWYPQFQSCVRYFLDHAQHDGPVQAMAAFINIQLPSQRAVRPVITSNSAGSPSALPPVSSSAAGKLPASTQPPTAISLTPYIRRLVATGTDVPGVLHGFFGDNWAAGVGPLHEVERRNYLFASKSSSWLDVKHQYDMPDGQSIPFLRPLQNVTEKEIVGAEANWSQWLAMQDWMVGPRNPEAIPVSPVVKNEED
ncbi:hypothetical protein GGR56DRAFT_82865 [Xylariaceae sp. FL0804]|nr:hypothetical protein GGR56DRAFT_82865 [Xylariaceae sp. FL0804]